MLNNQLEIDDHPEFDDLSDEGVIWIDELITPATNLHVQTIALSRARAYVAEPVASRISARSSASVAQLQHGPRRREPVAPRSRSSRLRGGGGLPPHVDSAAGTSRSSISSLGTSRSARPRFRAPLRSGRSRRGIGSSAAERYGFAAAAGFGFFVFFFGFFSALATGRGSLALLRSLLGVSLRDGSRGPLAVGFHRLGARSSRSHPRAREPTSRVERNSKHELCEREAEPAQAAYPGGCPPVHRRGPEEHGQCCKGHGRNA